MTDDESPDSQASWRDLREFRDVDLEASFVLSWEMMGETLQLELDLVLLPPHPLYDKPRPSQTNCMRAAVIEFPVIESLTFNGESGTHVLPEQVFSSLQPGLLRSMIVKGEGHYVLEGEFGTVAFQSERPVLRILSH